jgi:putative addiction module CopG family antidote
MSQAGARKAATRLRQRRRAAWSGGIGDPRANDRGKQYLQELHGVTHAAELAEMVKDKVASGAYASESDVVSAGLRALEREENGAADEDWLRRSVAESLADPRLSVPADEVSGRLEAHHAERMKGK